MNKFLLLGCALILGAAGRINAAGADTLQLSAVKHVVTKPVRGSRAEFSLQAQFPYGSSAKLQSSILKWTAEVMSRVTGDSTTATANDADGIFSLAMQNKYLKESTADIEAYYKQAREEKNSRPHALNYLLGINLQRVHETGSYITFMLTAETYNGGPHPMFQREYATFSLHDGRLLTWSDILLPKQKARFSAAVADGLQTFFGVRTFNDLKGRLAIEGKVSRTQFPLPVSNPAFLSEGLRVQYQYYEIAPYAMGAPSCTLTYTQASKCLTALGKKASRK